MLHFNKVFETGDVLSVWVKRVGDRRHKTLGYLERERKGPNSFLIHGLSQGSQLRRLIPWEPRPRATLGPGSGGHGVPCVWVAWLPVSLVTHITVACDLIKCCQSEYHRQANLLLFKE